MPRVKGGPQARRRHNRVLAVTKGQFGARHRLIRRASEARLLTTSWDGILHDGVHHGPTVEHCTIEECGDDSWSVQSSDYLVLKRDGAACVIASLTYNLPLQVGERLQTGLDAPSFKVVTLKPDYVHKAHDVACERIALAGYRLANLLNELFAK